MSAETYRRQSTWQNANPHNAESPKFLTNAKHLSGIWTAARQEDCRRQAGTLAGWAGRARLWAGRLWAGRRESGRSGSWERARTARGCLEITKLAVSNSFCNPQVSGHPQKCASPADAVTPDDDDTTTDTDSTDSIPDGSLHPDLAQRRPSEPLAGRRQARSLQG